MRWVSALLTICAIIVLPTGATAERAVVEVHAGEHRDYTRLLMQLPEGVYWTLSTQGALARLEIAGANIDFDLSQTFARIPRSRLHGIRQVDNEIELTLLCACDVVAYEDIPQFLVIDIRGSVSEGRLAPTASLRPQPRPGTSAEGTFAPMRAGQALAHRLRRPETAPAQLPSLTLTAISRPGAPETYLAPAPDIAPDAGTAGFPEDAVADAIIGALTRSAAIKPGFDPQSPPTAPERAQNDAKSADAIAVPKDLGAHVAISGLPDGVSRNDRTEGCVDPDALDIAAWFDSHSQTQHAKLLHHLTDEFGQITSGSAVTLARSYFALGFGAEGRMVLSLIEPAGAIPPELVTISYLLDLETPPKNMPDGSENCGKKGVLWAFLADPPQEQVQAGKLEQLVHAVKALPKHLRVHLAPPVITRLSALGHVEPAQVLQQAVGRVGDEPRPGITEIPGTGPVALQGADGAGLSRSQIIKLSDQDLLRHLPHSHHLAPHIRDALLDRALLRQFELRHSAEGDAFAEQVINAHARNEDFQNAFAILDSRETGLREDLREKLGRDLLAALVERAEDSDFVTITFAHRPWDRTDLEAATVHAIARRLAELGFEHQARQMELVHVAAVNAGNSDRQSASGAANISDETIEASDLTADSPAAPPSETGAEVDTPLAIQSAADMRMDAVPDASGDPDAQANAVRAQNAVAALRAAEQADARSGTTGSEGIAQEETERRIGADTMRPEDETRSVAPEDVDADLAILLQSERALEDSAALRARIQGLIGTDQMR